MSCSRTFLRFAVGSFLLLTAVSLSAQTKPARAKLSPEQSCKAYVKKFYDWYVVAVFNEFGKHQTPASERALKRKQFSFSPELTTALKADFAASAADPGYIVGLDFDPFTASQDPYRKYIVGKVTVDNGTCVASVHGVANGKQLQKYDLQAELKPKADSWAFTNFFYPAEGTQKKDNLLSLLKRLADDRATSSLSH